MRNPMLKIRTSLVGPLGLLSVTAILAQIGAAFSPPPSCGADDPVPNAPYSAQLRFTSVERRADGTVAKIESGGSEGRDSQGRTYRSGERRWTYLDAGKRVEKSEMLYQVVDPVAHTLTKWDTTSRKAKAIHWTESAPSALKVMLCEAAELFLPTPQDAGEKLGTKTIGTVVAEGTRTAYTVPGRESGNGQPLKVVHESWYCPELKIVVLETNDDPRSGSWRSELVGIVRGEPGVTHYRPPADYTVQHVEVPAR